MRSRNALQSAIPFLSKMRRLFETHITLAKTLAVALLIAGSVGLLWHQNHGPGMWGVPYFYDEWNLAKIPDWLLFGPQGWYPMTSMTIYWVFHTAPVVAMTYLASAVLCLTALFAMPFLQRTSVRALVAVPILAIFAYEYVVLDISGHLPDASTAATVLMNVKFGFEGTVFVYLPDILRNIAFIALLGLIILWPPKPIDGPLRFLPATLIILTALSVPWIEYRHKTGQHPAAHPTPTATALNLARAASAPTEPGIDPATYLGAFGFQFEKVVVIMDESIRGEFVSTSDAATVATPFLGSRARELNDFGIASSAANCSIPTRISFRHMLRQSDLATPIRHLVSRPTIWQLAKTAGYKTIHFDAFGSPITLTSGMTQVERSFIDQRFPIMDLPYYTRDGIIAKKLAKLLTEPGKAFIFVEKYGAHIPYDAVYPKDHNIFGADPRKPFNLSDVGELTKHYKNAVNWTVDGFFQDLLRTELPSDTLLIYTSDHGQSLSEGGRKLTHCSFSGQMRASEASVPLLTMSTNAAWRQALRQAAAINHGRTSHYNLPATVLLAMGFDTNWVANMSDPSLLDTIPASHRRLVRFGDKAAEFTPVEGPG